MTQTPLQEEEAAGTVAAGADLKEHDPTAGVVREGGEDRSWHEPADIEASRAGAARPSLRARLAKDGIGVAISTLWRFFKRRGITRKKRLHMPPSRTARTS